MACSTAGLAKRRALGGGRPFAIGLAGCAKEIAGAASVAAPLARTVLRVIPDLIRDPLVLPSDKERRPRLKAGVTSCRRTPGRRSCRRASDDSRGRTRR